MALTKCTECGKEVSDSAGKCPHCGAKVRKPAGPLGWIFAGILLLGMIQCTVSGEKSKERAVEAEAAKTPEQRAEEQKAKAESEARFQKAVLAAKTVKRALRDPDSVVWEDIYTNDDASVICLVYRARNGFGGMSRENIVFVDGNPSKNGAIWNRRCAGKGFTDMQHVRQAL